MSLSSSSGALSYSTLADDHTSLSTADVVALVLAAASASERGLTASGSTGLPPLEHILLTSTGSVRFSADGEEADGRTRVAQLAALLQRLLGCDAPSGERGPQAPGALLVLILRASGRMDLPAPSYTAFLDALARFGSEDRAALSSIYRRHAGGGVHVHVAGQRAVVLTFPTAVPVEPGAAAPERRAPGIRVSDLRRDLRDAEVQLFEALQQRRPNRMRGLGGRGGAVAAALLLVALASPWALGTFGPAHTAGGRPAADPAGSLAADAAGSPANAEGSPAADGEGSPAAVAGGANPPGPLVHASSLRRFEPGGDERPSAAGAGPTPTPQPPEGTTGPVTLRRVSGAGSLASARDPVLERGPDASVGPLLSAGAVGEDIFSPSFAGPEILFHAGRDGTLMRASFDAGGEPVIRTVLKDGAANYHVTVSPDGAWLAFDSDRDGTRGVYVARPDGTGSRRVSGDGYAAVPRWSSDGRRLVFVKAEPAKPRVWNVWVADLDRQTLARVSHHRVGQAWGGSWFPDGEHVAYSVEDTLVIASLQSGTTRVLRSPRPGQLVRTPAVSPDGRWIVFQVYRDGAWLLDVSTGGMRRLLADTAAEEFAWSPDGRRVAYHTRRQGAWSLWQLEWDPAVAG